jgi:hypothetical protein
LQLHRIPNSIKLKGAASKLAAKISIAKETTNITQEVR